MKSELEKIDYVLFVDAFALMLIGFIMIYSSSAVFAYENYNGDSAFFLKRQIIWAVAGVIMAVLFYRMPSQKLKDAIPKIMTVTIVLLLLTLVPGLGRRVGGARRWLKLPLLPPFQPFELVKLFYVLYLANVFSDDKIENRKKLTRSLMMTGIICIGLILEPDFGAVFTITAIFLIMYIISGMSLIYFLFLVPAAAVTLIILILKSPYRMKRIMAILNPWSDPQGMGFQTIQSYIAIGSGGIFGLGLTHSQQKFLYLPTPHTDYIFSIIGEELGLIGTAFVLVLFFIILWRGIYIARNTKDKMNKITAVGLTLMVIVQAYLNMGVAIGLMPPKGTTLPFLSSGGSSLVITIVAIGILLSISKKLYGEDRR